MQEMFLVGPLPDGYPKGWQISDGMGHPIEAAQIVAIHPALGAVVGYGLGESPERYDRWAIREPNGGGAVTVPFFVDDDAIFVGVVQQYRAFAKGYVTAVPRGFSESNETHQQTALREFVEETGATFSLRERLIRLNKKPMNPNSTYFVANPHKGEGVTLWAVKLLKTEVELRRSSRRKEWQVYKLKPTFAGQIKEVNEKIKPEGLRFLHIDLVQLTSDGFTLAALGLLRSAVQIQKRPSEGSTAAG